MESAFNFEKNNSVYVIVIPLPACSERKSRRRWKMRSLKSVSYEIYRHLTKKFYSQFGFYPKDTTIDKVVDYMYAPKDSSSLAITRILFGLLMLFDIADERGGAAMDKRWGNPKTCHFPLFEEIHALPMPYMAVVYAALWLGAMGIMLGYKYRIAAPLFTIPYWYLFVIDKSFWNNHSYLFGLVGILLCCVQAESYWSIDALIDRRKECQTVPYWNYFVLKYQFFILYFVAGLKKGGSEWLTGYSVPNLSDHWVFDPFKLFMSVKQTDYLVVHWFVFIFDLTVALWLMYKSTRHVAMVLCAVFHLMNSRLFRIGMFPWVCLATLPLFCSFDWPKRLEIYFVYYCKKVIASIPGTCDCRKARWREEEVEVLEKRVDDSRELAESDFYSLSDYDNELEEEREKEKEIPPVKGENPSPVKRPPSPFKHPPSPIRRYEPKHERDRKKRVLCLIAFYVFVQAFLPYSHFITKGYNNWANGLYGYSWDMMVHTWNSNTVAVRIVDNTYSIDEYIDPGLYTLNDRWTRHGDMVVQYAKCLKRNLQHEYWKNDKNIRLPISDNISIYVDVWCSMNGRFIQRMFDPKVDVLKAEWSIFEPVPFLMPLLDEAKYWRRALDAIKTRVYEWCTNSDVVFYADYPGYEQQKYIPKELKNVTLNIFQGTVSFEPKVYSKHIVQSLQLKTNDVLSVNSDTFHKIVNIGQDPAYYYYTFYNTSRFIENPVKKEKLPLMKEFGDKLNKMYTFGKVLINHFRHMLSIICACG